MFGPSLLLAALSATHAGLEPPRAVELETARGPADTANALDAALGEEFTASIAPYLQRHCSLCHSGPEPRSDLDLTRFSRPSELAADEGLLLRIVERIERQEMPPLGPIPPSAAEDRTFLGALDRLHERSWSPELPSTRTTAPLRRLDRFELQRVLADLLGAEVDPDRLPVDGLARGWTHAGDGQWLTPVDVERWILLLEALALEAVPPLTGDDRRFGPEELSGGYQGRTRRSLSSSGAISAAVGALPNGRYRVTVDVSADQAGPDLARFGLRWNGSLLERFDVPGADRERSELAAELQLDDAAGDATLDVVFLNDYYAPDAEDASERDRNLHVSSVRIEGPLGRASASPFLERAGGLERLQPLLGGPPSDALLRDLLEPFAERAWRTGDAGPEFEDLLATCALEPDLGSALRAGLVEVLAAPRFLFLELPDDASPAGAERALATRLALFLWGRLPDAELLAAAEAGRLASDAGLARETERLLRAPQSEALVRRLADRWLGLAAFEGVAAESGLSPQLAHSMRRETELLLSSVLREDWPLETLLDARFTHVDARLAEHYGLPGLGLDESQRRVDLSDAGRRGLLGQASILTLTSEPERTSAVRRGKWVLETLLNTPPPPPPPDVGSLDAVAAPRDASLAERLALHRSSASCAGCHTRMDAIGLDLEGFGAKGRRVPGTGAEPALELAARLAAPPARPHEPSLRRSATEHLAELALARGLELGDRPWLGGVLARLERGPATLRRAILGIVLSEAFRDPPARHP